MDFLPCILPRQVATLALAMTCMSLAACNLTSLMSPLSVGRRPLRQQRVV